MDPGKSTQEKAAAASQMLANAGDVGSDLTKLKAFLSRQGVPGAAQIAEAVPTLSGSVLLSEDVLKQVNPEVARRLSLSESKTLQKLAQDPELKEELTKVLRGLDSPAGASQLLETLSKADPKVAKELLGALGGLEHGALNQILTSTLGDKPAPKALANLLTALPSHQRAGFGKVIKDFTPEMLNSFMKLASKSDAKTVGRVLDILSTVDSKTVGKGLALTEKLVTKLGLTVSGEVATKLLKGLTKMVPLVGAAPAAYDFYNLGAKALDPKFPPELRFLAGVGAGLNGADAVMGVIEALGFTNVEAPVQIALGVAEVGLDLVLMRETERFEALAKEKKPYVAPKWLDALVVGAALSNPAGVPAMISLFGVEGSQRKIQNTAYEGGKLTIELLKGQGLLEADMVGASLKLTGDSLHLLADIVRNPEKYGEGMKNLGKAAFDKLLDVAKAHNELTNQAWDTIKGLAKDLKAQGAKGFEKLTWIAQHPGEAATIAADAMSDMMKTALRAGNEKLFTALTATLKGLNSGGQAILDVTSEVLNYTGKLMQEGGSMAKRAMDGLGWMMRNPGTVANKAKDKLIQIASSTGTYAKQAFEELYQSGKFLQNQLKQNVNQAYEGVREALDQMARKGQAGVELIAWAAKNPVTAGTYVMNKAVETLKTLATSGSGLMQSAVQKLQEFGEGQSKLAKEAREAMGDLIRRGTQAGEELLTAWKTNLTEGGRAVISGFKDLGSAGAEQLAKIARKGGELAQAGLNHLEDMLRSGKAAAFNSLEGMVREGGALAGSALNAIRQSAPGQFAERTVHLLLDARQEVRSFIQQSGKAFDVAKSVYEREGFDGLNRLIQRTGRDMGSYLISSLDENASRLSRKLDPQGLVTTFQQSFGKTLIELVPSLNLGSYFR